MRGGYGQGGAPRGRGGYAGGAKANNNNNRAADARAVMGVADALYASSQGAGSNGTVPSDALLVRVSSIVQPVTEDLMRRVFDSAGVTVRHVKVDMTASGTEAVVHARFADMYAAERALNALNGRNIFNNANKMTITYARSSRSSNGSSNGGNNAGEVAATSAVLATPPHMAAAMLPMGGAALPGDMAYGNNAAAANMQLGMMYNAPMAGLSPYDGGSLGGDGGGGVAFAPGQAMMPYAVPQAGGAPYMNAAAATGAPVMPPVQGAPGMALYHTQPPQPQLPPQPLSALPLPQVQMNGGNDGNAGGLTLTVGGRAVGRVRGVGGGRGRGAAAGGGGYGMTTMSYATQAAALMGMSPAGMMSMMQSPGQAGAIMGLPVGMGQQGGNNSSNNISNAPTVYISVTTVPADEPLQTVFVLLEAYGGVVSIRRNHNKKEIMTVKMASIEDADQVIRYVQRVPLGETGTLSSKRFANYTERHPCTDDGDPLSLETTQFDFTASRHRSPAQRSKSSPTSMLRVTGCAAYSEAELMTYLNTKGFYPERITKEDDGAFTVQIADTRTAVKLLIQCHGNVCNQERTNVIFIDGPKTAPSAAATATSVSAERAASKSDTTTHAATTNGGDVDDEEQMQQQHGGGDGGAVLQH